MRDYKANLEKVYNGGIPVESRVGGTREWMGLQTTVVPGQLPRRPKMRRELGYMELCQFLSGIYEPELIKRVAPNVDMGLFGRSAVYGPRVIPRVIPRDLITGPAHYIGRDQLADVIDELTDSSASRRAVVTISAPDEPLSDQPCISSMQFLLRGGRVNMEVYARSWDLWFGAPHDMIVLSGVLQVVSSCLSVLPGTISVHAASAHIYERSLPDVSKAISAGAIGSWSFRMPNLGDLKLFRQWADVSAWDPGWISGPPKHLLESWNPRPVANVTEAAGV